MGELSPEIPRTQGSGVPLIPLPNGRPIEVRDFSLCSPGSADKSGARKSPRKASGNRLGIRNKGLSPRHRDQNESQEEISSKNCSVESLGRTPRKSKRRKVPKRKFRTCLFTQHTGVENKLLNTSLSYNELSENSHFRARLKLRTASHRLKLEYLVVSYSGSGASTHTSVLVFTGAWFFTVRVPWDS